MDLTFLHNSRLISVAKTEQALAWLIEHGPVIDDPELPPWILRSLVADRRILRLQRSLYLVPDRQGRLLSLPAAVNAVEPGSYITGHGALSLHGLNDQDISHWWAVSPHRRSDIRYGRFRAHFVLSPAHARTAARTEVWAEGDKVTIATVAQAFADELRFMPYRLDWVETARVLRNARDAGKVTERQIVAALGPRPPIALARRAGLLLALAGARPNKQLLALARKNDDVTRLAGGSVVDREWRLTLPVPREQIVRAIQ